MKCYKGFNKDFKCRGLQYKEGRVYTENSAKICMKGFHYCHNPLDVLNYYPLIDDDGEFNQFAEVEPLDEELTDDGKKFCTRKIKIGTKLGLNEFVKASIDFIFEKCKGVKGEEVQVSGCYSSRLASSGDYSQLVSSGDSSYLASSGEHSQLVSSGDSSYLASSGHSSQLASMGYSSQLASSGNSSQLASSGKHSRLASSGNFSQLVSSGDFSHLASSGYFSHLASSGDYSKLASSGDNTRINSTGKKAIIANIGMNGKAKAKLGSFITLVEYDERYEPIAVKSHKVDGKTVKADTWYTLKNGKFTEVVE